MSQPNQDPPRPPEQYPKSTVKFKKGEVKKNVPAAREEENEEDPSITFRGSSSVVSQTGAWPVAHSKRQVSHDGSESEGSARSGSPASASGVNHGTHIATVLAADNIGARADIAGRGSTIPGPPNPEPIHSPAGVGGRPMRTARHQAVNTGNGGENGKPPSTKPT